MKIRKATLEDIPIIDKICVQGAADEGRLQFSGEQLKIFLEYFKKFKKKRINEFKKNIKSESSYLIVVEEKKEIIGFGVANIEKEDKRFGETDKIYIKKEFRRKGIGSKIKKELLKWLKHKKVKYISAKILVKNKPSIELNKKFGFKVSAVRMDKKLK